MNRIILIVSLLFCAVNTQCNVNTESDVQTVKKKDTKNTLGPNDFPELIHADIPGAPKLGKPQLIMGDSLPVRGEGNGWVAPAVYDWNGDGKKDVLIGEFGSGRQWGVITGHHIRVYQNKGTDAAPEFSDEFIYAREIPELKESTGTPLSIYTFCCFPFTPRFADLDNDGFTDLLSGQYTPGYITWFRGSANGFLHGIKLEEAYDPIRDCWSNLDYFKASHEPPITDFKSRKYWMYSSAAFGDFDDDGDQDMIVGGEALRICENIGTKSVPKFGKRELLYDVHGKQLESHSSVNMVPYVVDRDRDGTLDILMTDAFTDKGKNAAVTFFRGVKTPDRPVGGKEVLRFEAGVPLFKTKNGKKEFPGSWLNICVTDWNNDGVNDLLIGTSVATLKGTFDHDLSWSWEHDTGIGKLNPLYYPDSFKENIEIQQARHDSIVAAMGKEEALKKYYVSDKEPYERYYGKGVHRTLAHKGYVYVMLGEK
ncbi:FG-GAP repeat protein [Mariniflexile rhizosphaerae]|uniref:FG-GAP repeat domain-containing protein n=1 Tax=unclassified Mariniflexile TaxID=2643887 RepID=UPI000E33402D|nr:VCBS repeat-containing protein [Mariniflexile sp. TRM1-10]AXP80860.1 FG-GAP repeat protein [Mariniflexile sp. TRM1-10]